MSVAANLIKVDLFGVGFSSHLVIEKIFHSGIISILVKQQKVNLQLYRDIEKNPKKLSEMIEPEIKEVSI